MSPLLLSFSLLVFTRCKLNKLVREKMDFSSVFFTRVDEIGASISLFCYPFLSHGVQGYAMLFTFHPRLSALIVTIRGKKLGKNTPHVLVIACVCVCGRSAADDDDIYWLYLANSEAQLLCNEERSDNKWTLMRFSSFAFTLQGFPSFSLFVFLLIELLKWIAPLP